MPSLNGNTPDLTYNKGKGSSSQPPHKTAVSTAPTLPEVVLSSPQTTIFPNGTAALVLTLRGENTCPPQGFSAEFCFDETKMHFVENSAWLYRPETPPVCMEPRESGHTIFSIPEGPERGETVYLVLTVQICPCEEPPEELTAAAVLYADGMPSVSSNAVTFPLSFAHLEAHKESLRSFCHHKAAFRIQLTNTGSCSACGILLEDQLPPGFRTQGVYYNGFELAENLQYTVNDRNIRIQLPTCIQPQAAGELKITGTFQ